MRAAREARARLAGGSEVTGGSLVVRGRGVDFALTRAQLAEVLRGSLAAFAQCVRDCLAAAQLEPAALPRVVLTGGGISEAFAACLCEEIGVPRELLVTDPEGCEAVFGAALAAARSGTTAAQNLQGARDGHVGADLGLRVFDPGRGRPGVRVVVPRGTALPCTRSAVVFTTRVDQDHLALDVVEREEGHEALRSLADVRLGPLGRPGKNHPIELEFVCGLDGSLRIEARDPRSGRSVAHVVENAAAGPLAAEQAQVQRLRINE
jgi:molecular chaperone DnaK (HSP70)